MNEIKIKLEFVVNTSLNVGEVRSRLRGLTRPVTLSNFGVLKSVGKLVDAKINTVQLRCLSHSASYNTPGGRKPVD